ncbi:hypothetical protein ACT4MK_26375 [Bradyrhizobium barranii]|uniref:hypothetical protein n=1 Tax=Bradyrhizobium TaxID=374 RepID=UPI003F214BAE
MEVRYLIRGFQHFPQRGSIAVDRQPIFEGFVKCYSARQRPCDDRFRQGARLDMAATRSDTRPWMALKAASM